MPKQTKKVKVVIPVTQKKKKSKMKDQELTRLGSLLRNLGAISGSSVGALLGQPTAGSATGRSLGAAISKWLGSGDYQVSSNTFVPQSGSNHIPMMHKTGQSVVIRHKEYVCEVMGSTSFARKLTLTINPGNSKLFPWLSGIAGYFEQYRIKGMVYHYVPTSGTAVSGTNPAIGSVMLQTSYRANAPPPTSKVEVLNEYWASEGAPNAEFCHPIECDPKENPYNIHYVRQGSVPEGDSELLYDMGATHICTSGMPGANVVGDLWVSYEIELLKPVVVSDVTWQDYRSCTFTSNNTTLFGLPSSTNNDFTFSADQNTIIIPCRRYAAYRIYLSFVGNGISTTLMGTYTGASPSNQFSVLSSTGMVHTVNALTNATADSFSVKFNNPTATSWTSGFIEVVLVTANPS